jgi:hypothetical protein
VNTAKTLGIRAATLLATFAFIAIEAAPMVRF